MTRTRILTLGRAVDQFRVFLALQKGASPKSIATYDEALGVMLDVLGADIDPSRLDEADALDVIARWAGRAPNTLRKNIYSLRRFGRWLERIHGTADPFARIEAPRRAIAARPRPTGEAVEQMLSVAEGRDRLVIELLAYTGMRVSDLIGLRWSDVDLDARVAWIRRGKGNKGRGVPLPESLPER